MDSFVTFIGGAECLTSKQRAICPKFPFNEDDHYRFSSLSNTNNLIVERLELFLSEYPPRTVWWMDEKACIRKISLGGNLHYEQSWILVWHWYAIYADSLARANEALLWLAQLDCRPYSNFSFAFRPSPQNNYQWSDLEWKSALLANPKRLAAPNAFFTLAEALELVQFQNEQGRRMNVILDHCVHRHDLGRVSQAIATRSLPFGSLVLSDRVWPEDVLRDFCRALFERDDNDGVFLLDSLTVHVSLYFNVLYLLLKCRCIRKLILHCNSPQRPDYNAQRLTVALRERGAPGLHLCFSYCSEECFREWILSLANPNVDDDDETATTTWEELSLYFDSVWTSAMVQDVVHLLAAPSSQNLKHLQLGYLLLFNCTVWKPLWEAATRHSGLSTIHLSVMEGSVHNISQLQTQILPDLLRCLGQNRRLNIHLSNNLYIDKHGKNDMLAPTNRFNRFYEAVTQVKFENCPALFSVVAVQCVARNKPACCMALLLDQQLDLLRHALHKRYGSPEI